ncbi:MAG: hypothetical protein ACOC0B_02645 [bacterium]
MAVAGAAGFVTGFDRIVDPAMPVFFAAVTLMWGVLLRFPRAVGLPVLFLALASTLLVPPTSERWHAVLRNDAHVATLRVLDVGEGSHTVEWTYASRGFLSDDSAIHTVEGQGVRVELRMVRVPSQAFMVPAAALVRAERLTALERTEEGMRPGESVALRESERGTIVGRIDELLVRDAPGGFESSLVRADIRRPVLMADYRLVVKPDGTAEFVRGDRNRSAFPDVQPVVNPARL